MRIVQAIANALNLINGSTSPAIQVTQTGNAASSTATGGAVNINNTASTGAGLVVYSNHAEGASGRLLVVRSDNAAFDQTLAYFQYEGTGHGVIIDHQGTGSSSNGLTVTSTNSADTALGIRGCESGRGTIKVTHEKPDGVADANASILSTVLSRQNALETTTAQHIFLDSDHALADTTQVIQHRNNGTKKWALYQGGFMDFNESNGSTDPGAPAANFARLYARDNGSGKTQLCVRFPTGAVQVLATEP